MTTTSAPAPTDVSLGHPVRSFVLALLAVGAVLLALQWTGFVHPDIEATGEGTQVLGDGAVTVTVTIQNRSALSVEVVGVEWPTTASTDAAPTLRVTSYSGTTREWRTASTSEHVRPSGVSGHVPRLRSGACSGIPTWAWGVHCHRDCNEYPARNAAASG